MTMQDSSANQHLLIYHLSTPSPLEELILFLEEKSSLYILSLPKLNIATLT